MRRCSVDHPNDVRAVSRRALLLSVCALFEARAQDTTFSADVKVVNVFATVRNKQGQIIQNLNKEDFTLEEDARPQTVSYFSRESNLPLILGLLVDTSMSQRRVLGRERTASYRFLDQVLREDKDKAFVIHFDREVELLEDLTSSRKRLESALTALETPEPQQRGGGGGGGGGHPGSRGGRRGGGTKLFDAVLLASDEIMKKQQGRKALIVLSDGVDNGSKVSLSTAIEAAQRADTLVYSILFADEDSFARRGGGGFGGGGMGRRRGGYPGGGYSNRPDGKKILQQISRETGGGFFEVSKKLPVDQIYSRVEEELRNQYSLGYTPDRPSSGFHKISLTLKQKGLIVQARDGYYGDR
jgi:VWFA-related protein